MQKELYEQLQEHLRQTISKMKEQTQKPGKKNAKQATQASAEANAVTSINTGQVQYLEHERVPDTQRMRSDSTSSKSTPDFEQTGPQESKR